MRLIADLQIHSHYSRAVSGRMTPSVISSWAKLKGIGLVATGDWTHPLWYRELQNSLEAKGEGMYGLKGEGEGSPSFLLSTEISSIYSQGDKVRRVHTLVFSPSFEVSAKISRELTIRGANLMSDGRPIMRLTPKNIAEISLGIDSRCLIIPAHAWTPHFSLYGSVSGFDSVEECFGEFSKHIYAIETGLSSDPAMNWRIGELSGRRIVSFSDAHSPQKMGREATVFDVDNLSFEAIREGIMGRGKSKIASTIEFYPEEGKYHYTGHRNCNIVYSPNEARKLGTTCPVCGRSLTVGVMSRVEELASEEVETKSTKDKFGVRWISDEKDTKPPYVMMVPLLEILAEALGSGVASQKVNNSYESLIAAFGSEFGVLLETLPADIEKIAGPRVSEGISKVRSGDIVIEPGYDGVFGKVKIWREQEEGKKEAPIDQGTLF